jgi:hypothetical protein
MWTGLIAFIMICRGLSINPGFSSGVARQLDATSWMAWENRIALNMILAEKGGICW